MKTKEYKAITNSGIKAEVLKKYITMNMFWGIMGWDLAVYQIYDTWNDMLYFKCDSESPWDHLGQFLRSHWNQK